MSIRLRINHKGNHVALCAAKYAEQEGDIYLHDDWHTALADKFAKDWNGSMDLDLPGCRGLGTDFTEDLKKPRKKGSM